MKSNAVLQQDVMDALRWEPGLNSAQIGVLAQNGIVTLTGRAESIAQKFKAERTAERVAGVKAVVQQIDVELPGHHVRTDADLAQMALNVLKWNSQVPADQIQIKVEDGWVTLLGQVEWWYQQHEAEKAIRSLTGVKGLTNAMTIKPSVQPTQVKEKIRQAFHRTAQFDANGIEVEATGRKVVLRGKVHSWKERRDAETAAWSAPGVASVEDLLAIEP